MGTFTKSFGAYGGYICADRDFVQGLRASASGALHEMAIFPPVIQQVISSMTIIMGEDGTEEGAKRLAALRDNSNLFRDRLIDKGFKVVGDADSPVVPVLLLHAPKIGCFSRECLERGLAVVVVGFPATPLLLARARFCLSASHTREDLEMALDVFDEIGDRMLIKYEKGKQMKHE
eukprot:TRINITY_DN3600_c1_g1_i4.p2 TRINITY_DN3600_c1_g1~~TRINITY_DN3600_c1_g1_i4.p2  ORF type:complete len:176 (-),score=57.40 TRINITY_DN3600_c1_g1_i4:3-530(-)